MMPRENTGELIVYNTVSLPCHCDSGIQLFCFNVEMLFLDAQCLQSSCMSVTFLLSYLCFMAYDVAESLSVDCML